MSHDVEMVSLDDITALAERAFAELPENVKTLCGAMEIRVADWPTSEPLRELGMNDPLGLLGLFEGIGLAHGSASPMTGALPNRVWLYRQPILAYAADTGEGLDAIVRHVLVHEIGHHFGLSDADMDAIDEAED